MQGGKWISFLFLACAGTGSGCSASKSEVIPVQEEIVPAFQPPAGIDLVTARAASQLADSTFVSTRAEKMADTETRMGKQKLKKFDEFWSVLETRGTPENVPENEKKRFEKALNSGVAELTKWKEQTSNGTNEKTQAQAFQYCLEAQMHLENAVKINPFDTNARALLSVTYYTMQRHFNRQKNYEKATEVLERLTRIEKGEHELFRLLGENYMGLEAYKKAAENFEKAEDVLRATSFESPPDTSLLFYYAYTRGDVYARMHDAPRALAELKTASNFAREPQEKQDIINYLNWINWDGGVIANAEKWDKINELEQEKKYELMVNQAQNLLPLLKTENAKITVQQKTAVIEFEFLGRRDSGVERMRLLFEALPPAQRETPNARSKAILDSFGAMLYRLGVDALEAGNRKDAFAYFLKSTSFTWQHVARSLKEMVGLVWNDPRKAIFFGRRALQAAPGVLSDEETCNLASLMVKAHKSAGLYTAARSYYKFWKMCSKNTVSEESIVDVPIQK